MSENIKCLYIDDDKEWLKRLQTKLKPYGINILCEENADLTLHRLENEDGISIVLLDILFGIGTNKGKPTLKNLKSKYPNLPVIMITNTMLDDIYNEEDYKLADFQFAKEDLISGDEEIYKNLASAMVDFVKNPKSKKLSYSEEDFSFIVGNTSAMREVCSTILKVAKSDSTVLITGESGTGKEFVAREIHKKSLRNQKPFIAVNSGALASSLLESELFGSEKGAFTDSKELKKGRFEIANGGTFFLDEIGNTEDSFQKHLLRVLEEGEFERVGGTATLKVDVRIIAATNKNLKEEVAKKRFREDLFYRLNVIPIHLPSLRERKEDIEALYCHFVKKLNKEMTHRKLPIVSRAREDVLIKLKKYNWPGNIREFENVMERAFIKAESSNVLMTDHFILEKSNANESKVVDTINDWVENIWRGEKEWKDISNEFAANSDSRRLIIEKLIEQLKQDKDATGAIGTRLAKKLNVKRNNLSQILCNLNPPIDLKSDSNVKRKMKK